MLGRSRERHEPPPPPPSRAAAELEQWRVAAQQVALAWQVWLAADSPDRARAHASYLEALAEEELAALRVQRVLASRPHLEHERA